MPVRIQRKRTKGWKMPENTIYVGRPSSYGNPFRIGNDVSGYGVLKDNEDCVAVYNQWIKLQLSGAYGERPDWRKDTLQMLSKLKGKNLACWCRKSHPCHADVLLELANKPDNAIKGEG